MDTLKIFMSERGLELIIGIFGAIITAICGVISKAIKDFLNEKTKKDVVKTCVSGVEQQYKDLHGREKYDKVASSVIQMLAQKGITVTDLELKMLIESTVGEFNNVFDGYRPGTDDEYVAETESTSFDGQMMLFSNENQNESFDSLG